MKHEELLSDGTLRRIPMAAIVMALNMTVEYVPKEYVVSHMSFKAITRWVMTGAGKERLSLYLPTLQDEVERARKRYLEWEDRQNIKPTIVVHEKEKKTKKQKKEEVQARGPLHAYMSLRALMCAVNVALEAPAAELVDLLECLDDVPSVSGADIKEVGSLTSALQSLDQIFDSSHWKEIVGRAA